MSSLPTLLPFGIVYFLICAGYIGLIDENAAISKTNPMSQLWNIEASFAATNHTWLSNGLAPANRPPSSLSHIPETKNIQ